jgi:hypothetical protein
MENELQICWEAVAQAVLARTHVAEPPVSRDPESAEGSAGWSARNEWCAPEALPCAKPPGRG